MAQSCNLYFTNGDAKIVRLADAIEMRASAKAARAQTRQALLGTADNHKALSTRRYHALREELVEAGDPRARLLERIEARLRSREAHDLDAFRRSIGSPHVAEELPRFLDALAEIERRAPDASTLFTNVRGGTATMHRIPHSSYASARGYLAEVLGTYEIMKGRIDGLNLNPTDKFRFGEKAQTGGGLTGGTGKLSVVSPDAAGRLVHDVLETGKRATSESDLRISRHDSVFGVPALPPVEVGVDFKWTGGTSRGIGTSELRAAVSSLLMGEVSEFHYVTNASFSSAAHLAVAAVNGELRRIEAAEDRDLTAGERLYVRTQKGLQKPANGFRIVLHERAPI